MEFKSRKIYFLPVLIGVFLGSHSGEALAAAGNGYWSTHLLGGGSASGGDPSSVCEMQRQSYAPTAEPLSTGAVQVGGASGRYIYAQCNWKNFHYHGSGYPVTPAPSTADFVCDNTGISDAAEKYYPAMPGRCVRGRELQDQKNMCPAAGNPVSLASGAKFQRFADFQTADGKLLVGRTYRNQTGEQPSVRHGPVAGLGTYWRFNFADEIHFNTFWNRISLLRPDGTYYKYYHNGGGVFVNADKAPEKTDIKFEFVGTWSGNPYAGVTTWNVTDLKTGRVTEYKTYQRPNSTAYNLARPTKITEASGYVWNFTYAANGVLSKIEDNFGRALDFTWIVDTDTIGGNVHTYENRVVSRIDLPDGTYLSYSYAATAGSAHTDARLEKVEHFDATNTPLTEESYHYDDTNLTTAPMRRYWLTGITDAKNVRFATWVYDIDGRVTSSKHGTNQDETQFAYSYQGSNIYHTTVTNPLGKDTIYKFKDSGFYRQLTEVDGQASANCVASNATYTYGSDKRVATRTDEEGNVTQFTRNTRGLPTTIVEAAGTPEARTTTIQWHANLDLPTQTVTANLTIDNTYSTTGLLTGRTETDTTSHTAPYSTNGQTRTWAYTYSTGGKLLTEDGPLSGPSDTITYTYDANGYLATITDANAHVTTVNSVNGRGLPTQVTDENGTITQFAYDDLGRVTTITANPGADQSQWTMGYDAIGQVTSINNPSGASLTMTYNDVRRLTQMSNGLGETIDYTHNDAGNVTGRTIKSSTSTIVYQESRTFDELSRLLTKVGQSGATWTIAYDKNSNVVSVQNPRSNASTFAYDGLDRLISETDANTAVANRTYTAESAIATYADPRTITTTYVNNGFGEVIRETSPDIGTVDYVRDARGLVTQKTDARGIVTQYAHDAGGRLTGRTYPANISENVTFTYDSTAGGNKGAGRLTSVADASGSSAYTYDEQGRIIADARTIGAQTYTTQYHYYPSGKLNWILYPSGRDVVFYYNANGDLQSAVSSKDSLSPNVDIATAIEWHPHGPIQTMLYGNGLRLWRAFDQDYRMDQQNISDGVTPVLQNYYGYTDALNLTNVWDNLDATQNQSFWHTATERIQNADGPWGALTFYHDDSDNRTNRILTVGGVTKSDFYGYPANSNRLTSITRDGNPHRSLAFDAAGNTTSDAETGGSTKAFVYDSRGQLKTVTIGASLKGTYIYNYAAQLVSRTLTNTTPSGTVHYIHDLEGNVIAETDGLGNSVREYIWMPSGSGSDSEGKQAISASALPLAVVADVDTTPKLYYVHGDHLNRPIAMMDASKAFVWRAMFLPFGGVHSVTGTAATDSRFPGQWFNLESGLHYNWHRHYDPTTGRYLQPDPLGMPDGPSRYAYAVNSPQMAVDPDGLQSRRNLPRYSPSQTTRIAQYNNLKSQIRQYRPSYSELTGPNFVPTPRHIAQMQSLLFNLQARQPGNICPPIPGARTFQSQIEAAIQHTGGNLTVGRGNRDLFRLRADGHGHTGANATPMNVRNVAPNGKVFTGQGRASAVTRRQIRELYKAQSGHGSSILRTKGGR